jgi:hypothetical protein
MDTPVILNLSKPSYLRDIYVDSLEFIYYEVVQPEAVKSGGGYMFTFPVDSQP